MLIRFFLWPVTSADDENEKFGIVAEVEARAGTKSLKASESDS